MTYITCKCGTKLNSEEMDINNCPICEDIVQKGKRRTLISDARRRAWRVSQRKHRKKFKGLLT